MREAILILDPKDNVGSALCPLAAGTAYAVVRQPETVIAALEDIPFGHKIALKDIPQGASVDKYGESIGTADALIRRGAWVHAHNLRSEL